MNSSPRRQAFLSLCVLRRAALWLTFWLAFFVMPVYSQDVSVIQSVPVILDGKTVVEFRAGFKTLTPTQRAANTAKRLENLAQAGAAVRIAVIETDISHDLMVGDWLLMSVFDTDAAAAGQARDVLAQDAAQRLQKALDRYRAEHGREAFALALVKTAVTLLGAVLLLFLWQRLDRGLRGAVMSRAEEKMLAVKRKTFGLLGMEHLRLPLLGLLNGIRLVVWGAVTYLAFDLCLSYFPQTRAMSAQLADLVLEPLSGLGKAFLVALPKIFVLLVVAWVVRYLLQTSIFFFERIASGRIRIEGFYTEWATPTRRIVNLLIIIAGVMVAFPYIPGSDSDAFKGISIFLGVLLSIGSSGIIANLMTGLTITYMRAFKVGDVVKINDTLGTVVESSLLVTRLRTPKGLEITLPNSLILAGKVINFSASGQPYLTTEVTIGYDAPWRQVHAMLIQAAARTSGIATEPASRVLQTGLEDFYTRYELNVVIIDPVTQGAVLSELHGHIQDVFNEYGVQIMSPNFEAQPEVAVLVPRERWHAAPAVPDSH